MAYEQWFTIPKLDKVDRGNGEVDAISINSGFGKSSNLIAIGVDGGLTLEELEQLEWRIKQGIHLIKTGKLLKSKA